MKMFGDCEENEEYDGIKMFSDYDKKEKKEKEDDEMKMFSDCNGPCKTCKFTM